jgi:hypothetical protein
MQHQKTALRYLAFGGEGKGGCLFVRSKNNAGINEIE